MKKNIGLIGLMAILCFILVVLCSCGDAPSETSDTETSSAETSDTETSQWEAYKEYIADLDPDRTPLPSFEELQAVTVNMPFNEAKALLGKPQRIETVYTPIFPEASSVFENERVIYETAEGIVVSIEFVSRWSESYVFSIRYDYPDGTSEKFWAET